MHTVSKTMRIAHGQDGAVVLDIERGQVFSLNLVGSTIVELLRSGSAELEIAEKISREFDIGRDLARKDVKEFLRTLKKYHLVEEHEPALAV